MTNPIVPEVRKPEKEQPGFTELKPWYSTDPDSPYAYWEPYNTHLEHDPMWAMRFWSIQSAHDQSHWGWKVVAFFAALGYCSFSWTRWH